MTPENKRRIICDQMGFKDPDFLKWQDGMFEAETHLIKRQEAANNSDSRDYGVWARYVDILRELTKARYGGEIHATVDERQAAFLKAVGVPV